MEEVEQAMKQLEDRKSPGIDGIPAKICRTGGPALTNEIDSLCKVIWQEEEWPEHWTKSYFILHYHWQNTYHSHFSGM